MDDRELEATYDLVHQAALSGIDQDDEPEEWEQHPLFLQKMPENIDDNIHLQALQFMKWDGETPDTLAVKMKDMGNECFRQGKSQWMRASVWYKEALDLHPTDSTLKSIIHCNRATVWLGFQQYQKAAFDADWAIKYDSNNRKAFLRAAHAYQGMGNWEKALGAARAGMEITEETEPIYAEYQKVVETIEKETGQLQQRIANYKKAIDATRLYFLRRHILVGDFLHSWQANWDIALRFDEERDEVIWPIVIVYDEVLQTDFIEGYYQTETLFTLFSQILPQPGSQENALPWDTDGRYNSESCVFYVGLREVLPIHGNLKGNRKSRYIQVTPDCSLNDIFKHPEYVVPGYPVIYIAVGESPFFQKLGIKEVITAGGKVNPVQ